MLAHQIQRFEFRRERTAARENNVWTPNESKKTSTKKRKESQIKREKKLSEKEKVAATPTAAAAVVKWRNATAFTITQRHEFSSEPRKQQTNTHTDCISYCAIVLSIPTSSHNHSGNNSNKSLFTASHTFSVALLCCATFKKNFVLLRLFH